MTPEVKSAWIGSGSAIFVALISAVATYFIAVKTQQSQPDPVVIREPYIVTQKEVIREICSKTEKSVPAEQKPKDNEVVEQNPKLKNETDAAEVLLNKDVGIYYSLGDGKTKSKASNLVGKMISRNINATYYSIGGYFFKPDVPNKTYIYGLDPSVDKEEFIKSFRQIFLFTGKIEVFSTALSEQPTIDDDTWKIALDKNIYILVGA